MSQAERDVGQHTDRFGLTKQIHNTTVMERQTMVQEVNKFVTNGGKEFDDEDTANWAEILEDLHEKFKDATAGGETSFSQFISSIVNDGSLASHTMELMEAPSVTINQILDGNIWR